MKCPNCGKEVGVNEKICSFCGENNDYYIEPVTPEVEVKESGYYSPNNNSNPIIFIQPSNNPTTTKSSAGLVCGIIGLFFAGVIFGIIALSLSNKPNNAFPTASKVLGIIDIISGIFFMYYIWS